MRILCTHPGRFGDILWALPTMRAIAEAYGQPVEFLTSAKYEAINKLVELQPYIACAEFDPAWQVIESAPMTPRVPPGADEYERRGINDPRPAIPPYYDHVFHLGYEGWPSPTLAEDVYQRAVRQADRALPPLDLDTPWIATPHVRLAPPDQPLVWVGWSEEYFELKVGILVCLAARFQQVEFQWLRPWGGRYDEVDHTQDCVRPNRVQPQHRLGVNVSMVRARWPLAAALATAASAYVGCLSASWVLANALGLPVVAVEPNPQRHHPVFWRESPRNRLVLGGDGKPTFDARHVGDMLQQVLKEQGCGW